MRREVDYLAGNGIAASAALRAGMAFDIQPVGEQLRAWRRRRRRSQLDLALDAEISARHLSFVETGRARPSRSTVIRLAETLHVPPRAQNQLLLAAGFAPARPEYEFGDPALEPARAAVGLVLKAYEPFPALAVDRHWIMVAANAFVMPLVQGVAAHLLETPLNVLRLSLHPEGLASRIVNLAQWRSHILHRLQTQIDASGDQVLCALHDELRGYPGDSDTGETCGNAIAVPLTLADPRGELSFLSTTTMFGTPIDITLTELAIEAFLPANEATAAHLRQT